MNAINRKMVFHPMHNLMLIQHAVKESLYDFLLPNCCIVCQDCLYHDEKHLCRKCLYELPKTQFFGRKENPLEQLFFGRIPVFSAASLFFYRKNTGVPSLLKELKYKGNKEVGTYLGRLLGKEIKDTMNFSDADYLCPVPLHSLKQKQRGYNQAVVLAEAASEICGIPLCSFLERTSFTSTQTKKGMLDRFRSVSGIFSLVTPEKIHSGMHIILVDDVITTGSTLISCAKLLIPFGIKLSLISVAWADK